MLLIFITFLVLQVFDSVSALSYVPVPGGMIPWIHHYGSGLWKGRETLVLGCSQFPVYWGSSVTLTLGFFFS